MLQSVEAVQVEGNNTQYLRDARMLQSIRQALLPMENLHSHLQEVTLVLEASQDQDGRDDKAYQQQYHTESHLPLSKILHKLLDQLAILVVSKNVPSFFQKRQKRSATKTGAITQ